MDIDLVMNPNMASKVCTRNMSDMEYLQSFEHEDEAALWRKSFAHVLERPHKMKTLDLLGAIKDIRDELVGQKVVIDKQLVDTKLGPWPITTTMSTKASWRTQQRSFHRT